MEIKPIKTKADHRAALKKVEGLMSAEKGTRDGERLDVLVTLIEAYERKHFPMELPDPIEAIRFSMEQKPLGRLTLARIFRQYGHRAPRPVAERTASIATTRRRPLQRLGPRSPWRRQKLSRSPLGSGAFGQTLSDPAQQPQFTHGQRPVAQSPGSGRTEALLPPR